MCLMSYGRQRKRTGYIVIDPFFSYCLFDLAKVYNRLAIDGMKILFEPRYVILIASNASRELFLTLLIHRRVALRR